MTSNGNIKYSSDLFFDFMEHLIANPSEAEKYPDYCTVMFDENDQPVIIPKKKSKKSFFKAAILS
jgi:hypothetical protein